MDREAGFAAYQAMIDATEHQKRRAAGIPPEHIYSPVRGKIPVLQVRVVAAEAMTKTITKYTFAALDGAPLPAVTAGGHIDVVVAPEFFRQYSLCGDPADRTTYQIAVLREDAGRGGSKLMHRIFEVGRTVFISRPINHFPLIETAKHSHLFGGGIGVTPMIAMAHRLHAIGALFDLHYCFRNRRDAGFLKTLASVPWAKNVHLHVSAEGTRANLNELTGYDVDHHVYTCGPESFMTDVMAAATRHAGQA